MAYITLVQMSFNGSPPTEAEVEKLAHAYADCVYSEPVESLTEKIRVGNRQGAIVDFLLEESMKKCGLFR